MRRMGITEAGFKRLAEGLSIPEQEEAAEPIDDQDTGKKHGPPYTLYHTTSREGFESIKVDEVLKPKNDEGFVSFSAEPIKGGDTLYQNRAQHKAVGNISRVSCFYFLRTLQTENIPICSYSNQADSKASCFSSMQLQLYEIQYLY